MNRLLRSVLATVLGLASLAAVAQPPAGKLYTPGPFERVQIDGAGQVTLLQSDRDEVLVRGDADAQQAVDVDRNGDRLSITLPGGWKFWDADKSQVEVHLRHLSRLTLSGATNVVAPGPVDTPELVVRLDGAGLVRFDHLNAGQLRLAISGAGEAQLAGKTDRLSLDVSGKGKVTAGQFRAASASVSISGVGSAELWAAEKLDVDISGAGHVDYWGQPTLKQAISGLGSVNSRGDRH